MEVCFEGSGEREAGEDVAVVGEGATEEAAAPGGGAGGTDERVELSPTWVGSEVVVVVVEAGRGKALRIVSTISLPVKPQCSTPEFFIRFPLGTWSFSHTAK